MPARTVPVLRRLRTRLAGYRWRPVAGLAAISLGLSISLVSYLFGWQNRFFDRVATAFLVWFCLLAVTFLGILPFITWATAHWFGRGWAKTATARSTAATPASRRSKSVVP